jgi:non-heme chloroperoxidase
MPSITRDGLAIQFDVDGDGFPVILFPGAGGDASAWRHAGYVAALRERFTCVAIDPRGFGRSDTPPDPGGFAPSEHARDVLAVADSLGFDRFAMWGHSAGGAVTLTVATLSPHRVAAAVVAGMWTDEWTDAERLTDFAAYCRERGFRAVIAEMLEEEGLQTADWLQDVDADSEALGRQIEGLHEASALDLAAIQAQTLLLIGELEDPERAAQRTAEMIPHARAVHLPGLGHLGVFLDIDATLAHALPVLSGGKVTA